MNLGPNALERLRLLSYRRKRFPQKGSHKLVRAGAHPVRPKIVYHGGHGVLGFFRIFSVIPVPLWLIFIPIGGPQETLRHNRFVLVSDFDYRLPEELIAQEPLSDRAAARLLHLSRSDDRLDDLVFRDFPQLLRSDDLLVFNNTRVLPARLFGHRSGSRAQHVAQSNPASREFLRGKVEVLLTKQLSAQPNTWEALVHPGRKLGIGERLYFGLEANEQSHELAAEIVVRGNFGERHLCFDPIDDFFAILKRIGHIPLPPYIDRPDTPRDREQYQTVYAKPLGSVAATTAGLHFTPEVLDDIRARGIETVEVTLHVGLGTFQPIKVDVVEEQ